MAGLMLWVAVFMQVVDFLVAGSRAFVETDEGRKQWEDVINAYENAVKADIDGDGDIGQDGVPGEFAEWVKIGIVDGPNESAKNAKSVTDRPSRTRTGATDDNKSVFG